MPAKHTLLGSLLVTTVLSFAPQAFADVLGLRAGLEYWKADLSGEAQNRISRERKIGKPVNFDEWQFYGEVYNSVWLNFEHPVPFVPNLRLTYTNIENTKQRFRQVVVGQTNYILTEDVALIYDNTDFTFYYEILDNWVTLDVGLTARTLKGEFEALSYIGDPDLTKPNHERTKLNEIIPMLYASGRVDLPYNLYVQSVVNGITSSGNTLYDADVRLGFNYDLAVLDIGVYFGYRRMALKTSDLGNLYADAYMDGLMTGLEVHF